MHLLRKLLALTLLFTGLPDPSTFAEQPNIILINIDDLGYADIGPFGSTNKTPNLDRMSKEGRKLTSHYAAPVCSPSRAALMTGSYAKRALPIPHVLFPVGEVGLHPDEVTVAELLKSAGYTTACIGKWHLGDQVGFLPTDQGFDTYFGIPYSNDMGPGADGSKSSLGAPLPKTTPAKIAEGKKQTDEFGIRGMAQPPLPLLENSKVVGRVNAKEQSEVTRLYTERAVEFIRNHKSKPFFLYLPHTAVHFPHYPREGFQGKSPNGLYGDWVEEVDWSVGQVLDTLRELNLQSNTLVIFTSDNGGPVNQGAHNGPLRGAKGSTFEGGIRTCTLAWWPGKIPAGTSTDAMTSMMDMLPTFAKLGGAELPTGRKLDGVDIWPVLAGDPEVPPRDTFFCYRGLNLEAVRSGPWKLHLALADNAGTEKGRPRPQLFHLGHDVGEKNDLAAAQPEVVARLQALAQSMKGDLGLEGIGPGCRPLGRVANPQPLIDIDGTVRADAVATKKHFP
ncbi:MAG: sulfatase [Pirellulaceae bacterium]|nr:sulfatase [Pirellulaceae bacterium]